MYEVIPIFGGLVVGFVVQQYADRRLKAALLGLLCALIGILAADISGELLVSWTYLLFDSAQALVAAVAGMMLFAWWQRRRV